MTSFSVVVIRSSIILRGVYQRGGSSPGTTFGGDYNGVMSDASPPEVRPISLKRLAAIALGTFLIAFLLLEALDPRWVGALRTPVEPGRAAAATPAALAQPPGSQPQRRLSVPRAAGPGGARAGSPVPVARVEAGGEAPDRAVSATAQAVVVETNGQGARVRAAPSSDAAVLAVLDEGAVVDLTGEEQEVNGVVWIGVRAANGAGGWVAGDFLAAGEPTRSP